MWEWTTEQRTGTVAWDSTNATHTLAVFRGGSFSYNGSIGAITYRNGYHKAHNTYIDVGFRTVLYIK